MESSKPLIQLTGYQKQWVEDRSRFKIGAITRQGGKSFSTSLECVLDCLERKTKWVLLSAGERQSKELMDKCSMHAKAAKAVIKELENEFWVDKDTKFKQLEIVFPNGSRIVGLPANPDTARGWSANIVLDEFALHKDSREIWKAMFPTVTRGYMIRMVSTFKGKTNKFYDQFFASPTLQSFNGSEHTYVGARGGWSKHLINIEQAVAMGLDLKDEEGNPCYPDDLRLALNDEDAWQEEFMCIPSDEVSAFLPHDLIASVEDVKLIKAPAWTDALLAAAIDNYRQFKDTKIEPPLPHDAVKGCVMLGDLYAGLDVGRKKDLSVLWLDQKAGGLLQSVAVIEMNRQPFFVQRQVLHTILSLPGCRRACIDETGIGAQLAESAHDMFGSKVEGITFTAENKETLAIGLKENFEDQGSRIPSDSTIRNSLHSVQKYATTTKHFRFDAERTDATGHADHFWAKALAVQAASGKLSLIEGQGTGEQRETIQGTDGFLDDGEELEEAGRSVFSAMLGF